MDRRLLAVGEQTAAFEDDAEVTPRQLRRVALAQGDRGENGNV